MAIDVLLLLIPYAASCVGDRPLIVLQQLRVECLDLVGLGIGDTETLMQLLIKCQVIRVGLSLVFRVL